MYTYPVEIYIYKLSQGSQIWCKHQFMQVLLEDEEILHTSVVVHGVEYSFGENGIEEEEPKLRPQYLSDGDFEEAASWTKVIGRTELTKSEVGSEVSKLRKDDSWFPYKFNTVEHNCHHFSETFAKMLCGENLTLPSEIYEFNKNLLSYRESWIDEFCEEENLECSK